MRKDIVVPESAVNTSRQLTNLFRRLAVDIVSPKHSSIKLCSKCGKPRKSRSPNSKSKVTSWCYSCLKAYKKAHPPTPAQRRTAKLWHKYHLTPEQYDAMLVKQNGVCAICKQAETSLDTRINKVRRLAIDHDHRTGKIRGLLCNRCNKLLGQVERDFDLYYLMLEYSKTHSG